MRLLIFVEYTTTLKNPVNNLNGVIKPTPHRHQLLP